MATTPPPSNPGTGGPAAGPSPRPAARPPNTTTKATETISAATSKLSEVVTRLDRTLRVLNSQFDKYIDQVDDVNAATNKHSKAVNRLEKSALNGAKSLADLQNVAAQTVQDLKGVGAGSQNLTKTLVHNTAVVADALSSYGEGVAAGTRKQKAEIDKQLEIRKQERTALLQTKKSLADLMGELAKSKTSVIRQSAAQERAIETLHQRQKALQDVRNTTIGDSPVSPTSNVNAGLTAAATASLTAAEYANRLATSLEQVGESVAQIDQLGESVTRSTKDIEIFSAALKQKLASDLDSKSMFDVRDMLENPTSGVADHLDSLIAALGKGTQKWEQTSKRDFDKRQLAAEMQAKGDVKLWNLQRKLQEQSDAATKHMRGAAVELARLKEEYQSAKLIDDPTQSEAAMASVAAKIADTSGKAQQAHESLVGIQQQQAAVTSTLSGRMNLLGKATNKLLSVVNGLATGAYLGKALVGMFDEMKYQATHGLANGWIDYLSNYKDAMLSGVSTKAYQETLAMSKMSQLSSASLSEFRNAMTSTTGKLFDYTGDRDESFRISGQLYQSMSRVGLSAGAAQGGMEKLVPIMGQLSRVTGKSTQEIAKMAAALYEDHEFRLTSLGMDDKEKAMRAALILQSERELIQKGYTLEQARAINKENAAARLKSTVQTRTKDFAVLLQQLGIASYAAGGDQTEKGRKLKVDQTRLLQIQDMLRTNKDEQGNTLTKEAQDKLRLERSEMGSRLMKEATTGALENQETSPQLASVYENMVKSLESITSFGGTKQEDIATGKINEATAADAVKKGEEGFFGGMFGTLVSAVQWANSIGTSNPVVLIASIVAAMKLSNITSLSGLVGGVKDIGKTVANGAKTVASGAKTVASGAAKVGTAAVDVATGARAAGVAKTAMTIGRATALPLLAATGVSLAGDYASEKLKESGHNKTGAAVGITSDAVAGAATGAIVGSVVLPVIGTAIGAATGGLMGAIYGTYNNWTDLWKSSPPEPKTTQPPPITTDTTSQPTKTNQNSLAPNATAMMLGDDTKMYNPTPVAPPREKNPSELVNRTSQTQSLSQTLTDTTPITPEGVHADTLSKVLEVLTKMYKIQQEIAPSEKMLIQKQLEKMDQPLVGNTLDKLDATFSSLFKSKG